MKDDPVLSPVYYSRWKMQPIQFIMANDMPFWMGNVVKYIMRADDNVDDLEKAKRYIDFRIDQIRNRKGLL